MYCYSWSLILLGDAGINLINCIFWEDAMSANTCTIYFFLDILLYIRADTGSRKSQQTHTHTKTGGGGGERGELSVQLFFLC